MSDPARRFEVVEDEPQAAPVAPRRPQGPDKATQALLLALSALSQRAILAMESCFVLIATAFVFYATLTILPTPNTYQLIGLGIFSVFSLIASYFVLHRRG